jgi:hypothetical protein
VSRTDNKKSELEALNGLSGGLDVAGAAWKRVARLTAFPVIFLLKSDTVFTAGA